MKQINSYIDSLFYTKDDLLEEVIASIQENGMPSISVSPSSGKLLTMLISISGAKSVLEIGALGGYSGICLARGFSSEGKLTSLELKEEYAKLAYHNLTKAGFGDQVSYMTGEALQSLEKLAHDNKKFDFFFIDADKDNYENYLQYCIKLAEPGALIVMDNVLARGSVADPDAEPKRHTAFMKAFNETVAKHPQLESMLIPIGDGLTLSKVIDQTHE
ncbi:O-methyltransferase [Peribacillus frigoritolerans]|uniref:O-methyltransferase n=1 Tax=Peribacillus frigoritolerans TaxID=450367 RepID=UPI00207AD961|nr:O-methyltransferase [Peribacillus frigoritolerans]MDM5312505.1 O-methyltransferase [Peribacillus frigoritolerans]USK79525.1 O-methyltransferase [Peribacillus frigoritolerans]UZD46124.1 O-methyltransferase [Peribacillus frigoritolerans]WJE46810.1 O-methyltransferase [Peribacillus frigoritolerans]